MKKIVLLASALLFGWMSAAQAHGPVRQKMKETIKIDAPAEAVWAIIQNFGDASWLPMVDRTTGEGGHKQGATRVLHLKDGNTISEELKKYNADKMMYQYKITDMSTVKTIEYSGKEEEVKVLPVANYAATIMVKSKGNGSEVTWKAGYYRGYMNNYPPEELNEDAANGAVQNVFKAGLENIKKLAESK